MNNWFGKTSSGVWNLVPLAWCGPYGRRETVTLLRILRILWVKLLIVSSGPCVIGLVWGLTLSSSVGDFLESLAFDNSAYTLYSFLWVHALCTWRSFLIKYFYPIKKNTQPNLENGQLASPPPPPTMGWTKGAHSLFVLCK